MITLSDYFGVWKNHKDLTDEVRINALMLLKKVNALIVDYGAKTGNDLSVNPKTKSFVSGETGGGFRPQDYPVGASKSSHKVGMGIDIYDRDDKLKNWLVKNKEFLVKHELYMENPSFTDSWTHLQSRPTKNRIFTP